MRAKTVLAAMTLGAALAIATPALATPGTWMQVSCVNPDGSAASNQRWTPAIVGFAEAGSQDSTACGPGTPMTASLSTSTPAPGGTKVALQYQPPGSSALIGGTVDVHLISTSLNQSGGLAAGAAALYEPALTDDSNDIFVNCSRIVAPCQNGGSEYSGTAALPSGRGGDLFVNAECAGAQGTTCSTGAQDGTWSLAQLYWAHLLLSTSATPTAAGFSGSALQPGASGLAHLVFTAADTGGPGVYRATVAVDGRTVYAGTPNGNGGACAPVGTDPASGAPMWDSAQPCPASEGVDLPVPTGGLPDGPHELSVSLLDAAGTSEPVFDQEISTHNPQRTPVPRGRRAIHARFVISWSWHGIHTLLRTITVSRLPRGAHVSLACRGRGCPPLRRHAATARRAGHLLHLLGGTRLRAGDTLRITVTAPGKQAERIELTARAGAEPRARLVRR